MVSTNSDLFRKLMLEKCNERIALGQRILREKGLTIKIAPFRLSYDRFYGSFVVFDAHHAQLESEGPMLAVENLACFEKTDYDKLYQYGVYGTVLQSVAPEELDSYSRDQYCIL